MKSNKETNLINIYFDLKKSKFYKFCIIKSKTNDLDKIIYLMVIGFNKPCKFSLNHFIKVTLSEFNTLEEILNYFKKNGEFIIYDNPESESLDRDINIIKVTKRKKNQKIDELLGELKNLYEDQKHN